MTSLYKWDDKPLVVDGKLAVHEDCCCCLTNECSTPELPSTFNITVASWSLSACTCANGTRDIPYLQHRYYWNSVYWVNVYDWRLYVVCADEDDLGLFFSMVCWDSTPVSRTWSFAVRKGDKEDMFNWDSIGKTTGTFTSTTLPTTTSQWLNLDKDLCPSDSGHMTIN